jgi:hypothetical protein
MRARRRFIIYTYMNHVLNSPNKIIKLVISLGLAPIIFYFSGILNLSAYYTTLGISTQFLDFSYQYYISTGFLNCIVFLAFLPLLLDDYYEAKKRRDEELLSENDSDITPFDRFTDKYISTASKIIPKYRREIMVQKMRKMFSFMKSPKIKIFFYIILSLVILFFTAFFCLNGNFIAAILIFQIFVLFLVSLFTFAQIKNIFIEKKKSRDVFSKFFALFFILFFILPICFGTAQALIQLKQNSFEKVKIYTKNEVIDTAGLMGMGKGFYFFRVDRENLFVSQNEIIKMESLANNH